MKSTFSVRPSELVVLSLFFAGLVFLISELDWLDNAVEPAPMIATSLLIAAGCLYLASRPAVMTMIQSSDRWAVWALLAVGLGTGTVSTASLINRTLARAAPRTIAAAVLDKVHVPSRAKSPAQGELLVDLPPKKWIHVPSDVWHRAVTGNMQRILLCDGYFGIEVVAPADGNGCSKRSPASNPSIERTSSGTPSAPVATAHVER